MRVRVPPDAAGQRLDRVLAALPELGSRQEAQRLLAAGAVTVDGAARGQSYRVSGGEELEFEPPERVETIIEAEDVPLRIAWEDEHLLVVDKPAGVVVHPGAGQGTGTLAHGLVAHGAAGGDAERPGIVHRLDRDTSGLLVVARSEEAHRRLQKLMRRRAIERTYLALVRGQPRSWRGTIVAPIGRDRSEPTRQSLDTDTPRPAVTHFEVERLLISRYALLRVRLETGRTHQIRVHLAAIDLPVVADTVYGVREPDLRRQFLHATRLAFPHPFSGDLVEVESPLPADLQGFLDRLAS